MGFWIRLKLGPIGFDIRYQVWGLGWARWRTIRISDFRCRDITWGFQMGLLKLRSISLDNVSKNGVDLLIYDVAKRISTLVKLLLG